MFALVDCNNFFVSCERVFNPALQGRPVVVLSNNDGCVIARSNEAKQLGIAMGAPLFQIKNFLEQQRVAVYSSNYTLYGDMSRRVMTLLSDFSSDLLVYSIDEAFLNLDGLVSDEELAGYATQIRTTILRGTGIPVTVGVAPTKTLAKVACHFGKKYPAYHNVCVIDTEEKRVRALHLLPVEEVWGVGRRHREKLHRAGVRTAWDLTQKSEAWVQHVMTATGVRTWKELQGFSCIEEKSMDHKKSICTSRSFSDRGLCRLEELEEAVANFAAECSLKLRQSGGRCGGLTVFAATSRFQNEGVQHTICQSRGLMVVTNDQQELISVALELLRAGWADDRTYYYKKAGMTVWDLRYDGVVQPVLFDPVDRARQAALARAVEEIKKKNGEDKIKIAVQGDGYRHFMKSQHRSRNYTTRLDDVIEVHV